MPFLRFSRDKRGVETFYLMHTTTNRRGKVRPRVLYWYRSPPDVKVGRQPFDPDVRRALEKQNPDITFDWRSIVETPIPSADADKWRERRRAERAAKHAAAEEELAEAASGETDADAEGDADASPAAPAAETPAAVEGSLAAAPVADAPQTSRPAQGAPNAGGDATRKRRRRRRGGGNGRDASIPSTHSTTDPSGD